MCKVVNMGWFVKIFSHTLACTHSGHELALEMILLELDSSHEHRGRMEPSIGQVTGDPACQSLGSTCWIVAMPVNMAFVGMTPSSTRGSTILFASVENLPLLADFVPN